VRPCNDGGAKGPDFWCAFEAGEVKVIGDEPANRAGVHIPVIDVPAILAGIGRSAAGESGHAPLRRGRADKQIA
jgi:hypothetical protein